MIEPLIEVHEEDGRKAEKYYIKAIEYKEKRKNFRYAARIAVRAKMLERAVENYERGGYFLEGAKVARKAGMTDKANQLQKRYDERKEYFKKLIDKLEKEEQETRYCTEPSNGYRNECGEWVGDDGLCKGM
ncbi:hypothetical protein KAT24_02820 [Candidatus Pacearchaeota archaeon]|nr:hypothetical protein [Candidatus Pacearchaeota archaeon]